MGHSVNCQDLIGYKSNEIRDYMSENHKDMVSDRVVNTNYKYLKYSDSSDSETIMFFLDPDSVCKSISITCDRMVRNEKIREFNSRFLTDGQNKWIDTLARERCRIEMNDNKWSSNFIIKPEKQYLKSGSN